MHAKKLYGPVVALGLALALLAVLVTSNLGCGGHHTSLATAPRDSCTTCGTNGQLVYPARQQSPDWSALGYLAYRDLGVVCLLRGGGTLVDARLAGLWVMSPDLATTRRVSPYGDHPSWSPDGRRLAFDEGNSIRVLDTTDGTVTTLTNSVASFSPRWSRDGGRIAYEGMSQSPSAHSVWTMRSDGALQELIGDGFDPDWGPSDSSLCYVRWKSGSADVSIVRRSMRTGSTIELFHGPGIRWPRVSPDGRSIAFAMKQSGVARIFRIAVDGTGLEQLASRTSMQPAWAPDGLHVAFADVLADSADSTRGVIWSLDLRSRELTQLTHAWPRHCP